MTTTGTFHQKNLFAPAAVASKRQTGRDEGEATKQGRLAMLREQRAVYVRRGQRALLAQLLESKTATADDVRWAVELPPGIDARCLGGVPGPLARAGIIRSRGYMPSARPERHASPIQVWELADRAAAIDWLAANDERPARETPGASSKENSHSNGKSNTLSATRQTTPPTTTGGAPC